MRSIVGNSEVFLIYVAIPASVILSKSQIFHRVISSIVDVKSIYGNQICFHLVPDFLIGSDDDEDASSSHLLNALVDEVYDRIPRFVDEAIVDTFPKPIRQIFQAPSFCLAEELRKVQFSYVPMGRGINPFGRHSLLQVGYRLSECRKWLIAACTDQRGEADNLHIWHVSETNDYKQIVSRIWEFVVKFLSMADVEWRVSIMKLGEMDEFELHVSIHRNFFLLTLTENSQTFSVEHCVQLLIGIQQLSYPIACLITEYRRIGLAYTYP